MTIELQQVGKRFRYDWILKDVSLTFETGKRYAITGPNGSGKSTLMKIISGYLTPSKGKINFLQQQKKLDIQAVYKQVSYAAPYIDLIEELSLKEAIQFHQRFKPFQQALQTKDILDILALDKATNKEIRNFSSGMKQRLKLILALAADTPLLLLDEPTTNLDQQGMDWYLDLVQQFGKDRLIIVASNVEVDYSFCTEQVDIRNYKS